MSIPFSSANFFAKGDAKIRPEFEDKGILFTSATGAFSCTTSGVGAASFFSSTFFSEITGASGVAVISEAISSPLSPIIAKIAFTGAVLPVSTPM